MTQKDPTSRLSISEYLNILQTKSPLPSPNSSFSNSLPSLNVLPPSAPLETNHPPSTSTSSSSSSSSSSLPSCGNIEGYFGFPPYFNSFLYKLYLNLHWNGITPDDRINIICQVNHHIVLESNLLNNLSELVLLLYHVNILEL